MTRVFEIWQYAGKVYGNERADLPPSLAIRGFSYTHEFCGKSAHYIIVTHDSNLSRDIALEFATAIHFGRFSSQRVDLSNCYLKRDDTENRLWEGKSE